MSYTPTPETYIITNMPHLPTTALYQTALPPYSEAAEPHPTYRDSSYAPKEVIFSFTDASIRQGFVRKVFAILFLQTVVTFGFIALSAFVQEIRDVLTTSTFIYISIPLLTIDFLFIFHISFRPQRLLSTPLNYISLVVVTLCTTIPLAVLCAYIDLKYAFFFPTALILASTLFILLFTFQSRREITTLTGFLLSAISTLITASILFFSFRTEAKEAGDEVLMGSILGVAGMLTIIFTMLWVALVRGIMFGEKKTSSLNCSPEDYILAAMLLYVAIILIFLVILLIVVLIFGAGNSSSNSCNGGGGGCHGGWIWFFPIYSNRTHQVNRDEEGQAA